MNLCTLTDHNRRQIAANWLADKCVICRLVDYCDFKIELYKYSLRRRRNPPSMYIESGCKLFQEE